MEPQSIAYEREAADGSAVRELAEIRTDGVTANIGAVFAQTGIAVIAKTFHFAFILNTTFVSLILTNEELTMGSDLISDAARIAMSWEAMTQSFVPSSSKDSRIDAVSGIAGHHYT